MDAEIIIRAVAKNVCEPEEIAEAGFDNLKEMVEFLIREEGLFGIVEDEIEIVSAKEIGQSNKMIKKGTPQPEPPPDDENNRG